MTPVAKERVQGWLSGFFVGVFVMAVADFTDLWICMGECGGSDREIAAPFADPSPDTKR